MALPGGVARGFLEERGGVGRRLRGALGAGQLPVQVAEHRLREQDVPPQRRRALRLGAAPPPPPGRAVLPPTPRPLPIRACSRSVSPSRCLCLCLCLSLRLSLSLSSTLLTGLPRCNQSVVVAHVRSHQRPPPRPPPFRPSPPPSRPALIRGSLRAQVFEVFLPQLLTYLPRPPHPNHRIPAERGGRAPLFSWVPGPR